MEADEMGARPERSGRKTFSEASPIPLGAYSIRAFCRAHALSEAMYFKLRSMGLGPDEMQVGRRRMVSIEAAAKWRLEREAAARAAAAPLACPSPKAPKQATPPEQAAFCIRRAMPRSRPGDQRHKRESRHPR